MAGGTAALVAALAGAGATIYGASQSGNGMPDGKHPYEQVRANFQGNNPNTSNYFGGTKAWTTGEGDDTRLHSEQTLSPGMEALAESMMGRAGAGRGTFDSGGMPDFMQNRYAQMGYEQSLTPEERAQRSQGAREGNYGAMPEDLSAFMPQLAKFDRPEFGFGASEGAVQYPEGTGAGFDSSQGQSIDRGSSNLDAMAFFNKEGLASETGLSSDDNEWLAEFFGNNPNGKYVSSNNFDMNTFTDQNVLTQPNLDKIRKFRSLIDQYGNTGQLAGSPDKYTPDQLAQLRHDEFGTPIPKTEPNPQSYDAGAFQSLVNSLAGVSS